MQTVQLDNEEWQKVMGIIAQAPWSIANPLLMKIGEQLQRQGSGNSREMQETLVGQQQAGDKH